MKPLFVLLILLGAAAISAHAQSPSATQAPGATPATPAHTPAEIVAMLGKRLSLSDEQKSQILPIITERQEKIQAIRNDAAVPPQQRMSLVQGIMKDSDAKINALLTPEQQQSYSQIEQNMRRMRPYHPQGSAAQ